MANFQFTQQQIDDYNRDGYLIINNFISPEEVSKLYATAIADQMIQKHSFDLNDQTGKKQNYHCGIRPATMFMDCLLKANEW